MAKSPATPPYVAHTAPARRSKRHRSTAHHSTAWYGMVSSGVGQAGVVVCKLVCLLAAACVCAGLAGVGSLLVAYSTIPRAVGSGGVRLRQDLFFNYSSSDATAVASLLSPADVLRGGSVLGSSASSGGRFLEVNDVIDVSLDLRLPDSPDNRQLFIVVSELLSPGGTVIMHSTRHCMLPYQSIVPRIAKSVIRTPFVLIGLMSEDRQMSMPLFRRYKERRDVPLAAVKVMLSARAQHAPPEVYAARLTVKLRVGWIRWVLRLMSPTRLFAACALVCGCVLALASSCGSLSCIAAAFWCLSAAVTSSAHISDESSSSHGDDSKQALDGLDSLGSSPNRSTPAKRRARRRRARGLSPGQSRHMPEPWQPLVPPFQYRSESEEEEDRSAELLVQDTEQSDRSAQDAYFNQGPDSVASMTPQHASYNTAQRAFLIESSANNPMYYHSSRHGGSHSMAHRGEDVVREDHVAVSYGAQHREKRIVMAPRSLVEKTEAFLAALSAIGSN